jgi:hypothetical protein
VSNKRDNFVNTVLVCLLRTGNNIGDGKRIICAPFYNIEFKCNRTTSAKSYCAYTWERDDDGVFVLAKT